MILDLVSIINFPHPFTCIFQRTNFDITNGSFCLPNRSLYRGLTVLAFKDSYKFFFRDKQEELICQAGIDRYHPLITNTNERICTCGAIIETKVLDPSPHICWDLVDFNRYQLINECCAQMLECGTITIMEAKFILWSLKENGEYRLNFYNFYFNKV